MKIRKLLKDMMTMRNIDKQTYEESYDIENDYLEKEKSIGKVLTKGQGFFRYYSALISTLRSYDINNIDNARVVYRLSDELLNNMYQILLRMLE